MDFHEVLALSDDELGHCDLFSHKIKLTEGAKVIHKRPYRSPHSYRQVVDMEIQKLTNQGVIEPSMSPWSAPLLLIRKKDGSHRVVVDYRELNSVTEPDRFPIPSIQEALNALKGAKVFSAIDLKSGFFQISMDEESRPLTAFATSSGHFQFRRMAMGLRNSPSTFQRCMNAVLTGLDVQGVLLYLDDLLIYSSTPEEHLKTLGNVLKRLKDTGLTLSIKKSQFMKTTLLYLGHLISPEGIRPDPDKINKLPSWPIPKTKKQVQGYLGYAGYFRNFIQKYASITKPLCNLTKDDTTFEWTKECQTAFDTLNQQLLSAQKLVYPDFQAPFYVVTDASKWALGAVLMQKSSDEKRLNPIEYASKLLNQTQQKYSTTDLEALAVDFGLSKFRYIIYGYDIIVVTDHRPLLSIFKTKNLNEYSARMTRLILRVQNYNPKITFVSGKNNTLADFLSRHVPETAISYNVNCVSVDNVCDNFSSQELIDSQQSDPYYGPIRNKIIDGEPLDKKEEVKGKTFLIQDDVLTIKDNDKTGQPRYRAVVPQALEENVIKLNHEVYPYAHPSSERTKENVQRTFFFKNLSSKISDYVSTCETCVRYRGNVLPPTPYEYYPVPGTPFETVHMDFIGPLNITSEGNKYLLVYIDYTTRYIVLDSLPNRTANNVAISLFRKILMPHSAPKTLVSDNALEFVSSVVKALCEIYKVRKVEITSRTPHANGVCERANKSIVSILKSLVNEQENDWDEKLTICEACMNSAYHQSLGDTPYFCLYGRDKRNPFERILDKPVVNYNIDDVPTTMFKIHQEVLNKVSTHLRSAQENYLTQSRKRTKERQIKPGDRVFIEHVPKPGKSKKLNPKWIGPYRVIALGKNNRLTIRSILHSTASPFSIHANRVKVVKQKYADPMIIKNARDVFPKEDDIENLPETFHSPPEESEDFEEIIITEIPVDDPKLNSQSQSTSTTENSVQPTSEEPIQNDQTEDTDELSPLRLRSSGPAREREIPRPTRQGRPTNL